MQLESMVARDLSSNRNSRRIRWKVGRIAEIAVLEGRTGTGRSGCQAHEPFPVCVYVRPIRAVLKSTRNGPRVSSLRFIHVVANRYPRETALLRSIVQPRSQRVCLPTMSCIARFDAARRDDMYIRKSGWEIRNSTAHGACTDSSNATNRTHRKRSCACIHVYTGTTRACSIRSLPGITRSAFYYSMLRRRMLEHFSTAIELRQVRKAA